MRIKRLFVCFFMTALFVIGCGKRTFAPPLKPPDIEEITAVRIITIDGFSCLCSDRGWIEQFLSVISSAQATDKLSIQDHPASDYYGEFNILNGKEVIDCMYYYATDSGAYIEKPYQGIYEKELPTVCKAYLCLPRKGAYS